MGGTGKDFPLLTVSRTSLLQGGSDAEFRQLINDLLTFSQQIQRMRELIAAELGVSPPQYAIMIRLAQWIGRPPTISELADSLDVSVPFIVTETGNLARAGLIKKQTDDEDARRVRLHLTARAKTTLEAASPFIRDINDTAFGRLSPAQFNMLRAVMAVLTRSAKSALSDELGAPRRRTPASVQHDERGKQPTTPLDLDAFRSALGCFATGVTILTTRGRDGTVAGITANSFTSVSLDPPLVLFNLDRQSDSLPVFEQAERFAVNILSVEQISLSKQFATSGINKWDGVPYSTSQGNCPILKDSLPVLECGAHKTFDGGDHVIFLAEVYDMQYRQEGEPLVYYRSRYRAMAPTG
jgi:flavin reductase (DIM6/NTAB) family NADH-FMN oxidoreductase RutF/DNA-binding MarR family transcriptional regulator